MVAVSLFLFCGQTAPATCNDAHIGPSTGEVVGAGVAVGAIVVGTVVLVHVHDSHIIKGCVFAGPNGVEIRTDNGTKTYTLAGDPNVKVGDLVKLHGTKVKKVKDSTGDQTFTVEKLNKDYGPCKTTP
jgi:hypothetical protein